MLKLTKLVFYTVLRYKYCIIIANVYIKLWYCKKILQYVINSCPKNLWFLALSNDSLVCWCRCGVVLSEMWASWSVLCEIWSSIPCYMKWRDQAKWKLSSLILLYSMRRYATPVPVLQHGRELGGEATWVVCVTIAASTTTRHQYIEGLHEETAWVAPRSCRALWCMAHQHFLLLWFTFDS